METNAKCGYEEIMNEAASRGYNIDSREFAQLLDDQNALKEVRQQFHVPLKKTLPKSKSVFIPITLV